MNIIDKLLYAGSGFCVAVCLILAFGMWRLAAWQPRDWKGE